MTSTRYLPCCGRACGVSGVMYKGDGGLDVFPMSVYRCCFSIGFGKLGAFTGSLGLVMYFPVVIAVLFAGSVLVAARTTSTVVVVDSSAAMITVPTTTLVTRVSSAAPTSTGTVAPDDVLAGVSPLFLFILSAILACSARVPRSTKPHPRYTSAQTSTGAAHACTTSHRLAAQIRTARCLRVGNRLLDLMSGSFASFIRMLFPSYSSSFCRSLHFSE